MSAPEGCPQNRRGLDWYYAALHGWRHKTRAGVKVLVHVEPARGDGNQARSCNWIHRVIPLVHARARQARERYEAWRAAQRLQNPSYAICTTFGRYCSQALAVASCESGRGVYARNGQYLGMFQMGSYARETYGHDWTALGQARAAYRYFVDSGRDWSPWSCKPW